MDTKFDLTLIRDDERVDDMGFQGLRVIQKPEDFCYGIDAVLLAYYASARVGNRVIDLGTGTAAIPLILARKTDAQQLIGVDVQKEACERAMRSVQLNRLEDRIRIVCADIHELGDHLSLGDYDTVVSNPPYYVSGDALCSLAPAKRIARHETTATLEDFFRIASSLLKERGDFYLVHRPSRLVDIFTFARKYRLEPKRLCLVSPQVGKEPNIALVQCVKNGGAELRLDPPLYVYRQDGAYTDEIEQIYERDTAEPL